MILRCEHNNETQEAANFAAVVPMEIEHHVWVRELLEALKQRRRLQGNRRMFIVNWAMLFGERGGRGGGGEEDDKEDIMDESD